MMGDDDAPTTEHVPAAAESSLRGQLRARREALAAERHIDVPIPGYGDGLVVRFRSLPFARLRAIRERNTATSRRTTANDEMNIQVDTLLATCERVMTTVDGQLLGLEEEMPELGDGHVTLGDPRLASALGFEPSGKARSVCYGVFNGNDMGIVNVFAQVSQWMSDVAPEVDEEFLGESQADGR